MTLLPPYRAFAALLPLILILASGAQAQRRNSISPRLKAAGGAPERVEPFDTLRRASGKVRFSGYDKTLRATKETIFVTNMMSDTAVEVLWFTTIYLDSSGRELHKLSRRVAADIPPGGTRRVDVPAWDTQHTFYYRESPRPRVSATPYSVEVKADSILVTKQ